MSVPTPPTQEDLKRTVAAINAWKAQVPPSHPMMDYAEGFLDALSFAQGIRPRALGIHYAYYDGWVRHARD